MLGPDAAAAQTGLIFVATLFGRPLGAAIFGSLADRYGRTSTTKIAIAGIAITTLLIALIPSHDIGGAATLWAFIALRFLGGIFLGGEYSAAIPLAMEWTAPRRRGLLSGGIMAMSPLANAFIAALTLILIQVLDPDAYAAWGWRLPFIVGAVLAAAMLWYYSVGVGDSAVSTGSPRRARPLADILVGPFRRQLWQVFVLMTGLWLFAQMAIPVLTGMLREAPQVGPTTVPFIMLVATLVSAATMLASGAISQRIGRRRFFVVFGALGGVDHEPEDEGPDEKHGRIKEDEGKDAFAGEHGLMLPHSTRLPPSDSPHAPHRRPHQGGIAGCGRTIGEQQRVLQPDP